MAKTVIVNMDGKLAMAVLPASKHVDLPLLKAVTGAKTVTLATEAEFRGKFPECETRRHAAVRKSVRRSRFRRGKPDERQRDLVQRRHA